MSNLGELEARFGNDPFLRRDAVAEGFSKRSLDGSDLHQPFRGVRTFTAVEDAVSRCRAYAAKMPDDRAFTGLSAAAVRGWPVPRRFLDRTDLDVSGPYGGGRARERRVRFTRVADHRWRHTTVTGLRVVSAELAMLDLARLCDVRELIVLGDAAVATSKWYPGLVDRGSTTVEALTEFLDACGRTHGVAKLRHAVKRIRPGVESPMESFTRLVIIEAGLPEPEVGGEIWEDGQKIATGDLVYRQARVVVEYEGHYHRQTGVWEGDIERIRRLESYGWKVIRLTKSDLFPTADSFIADLRQTLLQRGTTTAGAA